MVIAITGHTHAGKTTLARQIQRCWREMLNKPDHYEVPIRSFATPLRDVMAALTGLDGWKQRKHEKVPEKWRTDLVQTGRDFHKAVGQGMKQFLGEEVWVKAFFSRYTGDMIIDDMRFIAEKNCVHGITILCDAPLEIRARRGEVTAGYLATLDSRDEVDLIKPDFTLDNSYHISDAQVKFILSRI